MTDISVVIPAKNESKSLPALIKKLKTVCPEAEVIVVDDCSIDETTTLLAKFDVRIISHPYSKGNGAAIKTGMREASGKTVICMDADGQHNPEDITKLLDMMDQGYDMVVGARNNKGQSGVHRALANSFYNKLASWITGCRVLDLTSGFRAVNREKFLNFISLLPNKFSYPTTITMSFFRAGLSVGYIPIEVKKRAEGSKSHVNLFGDGIRFLVIIFKIGTLFSPFKIFFPISFLLFISGIIYYIYTFLTDGRFTNMGVLLLTTSVTTFLMGLISEQITSLMYKNTE